MIHMRTCIFHPKEKVVSWHGHIHLEGFDEVHIIAGFCKLCDKVENINGSLNEDTYCQGCYGIGQVH